MISIARCNVLLSLFRSERNSTESDTSVTGCEYSLILIFAGNFPSHIAAISAQGLEYCGIAKRIDSLVHMMYGIWIQHGYSIELAIVYTGSEWSVFLRSRSTICDAHLVCAGSNISIANILLISCFSTSRPLVPVQCCPECIGILPDEISSIRCFASLTGPKRQSNICWNFDNFDKLSPGMVCESPAIATSFPNCVLPGHFHRRIEHIFSSDLPLFWWFVMCNDDHIVDISALLGSQTFSSDWGCHVVWFYLLSDCMCRIT